MREQLRRRRDRAGESQADRALRAIGRRLGGEAGQDVLEYAGMVVLVAAIITTIASIGIGVKVANAVGCEVQRIELTGCGASGGASSGSAATSLGASGTALTGASAAAQRQHEQAVSRHPVKASQAVPAALRELQRDAAFFRTPKGELVALVLAREIAGDACHANGGDMVGPDYLCSGSQYYSNVVAIYHALQTGQDVGHLNLIEPSFNTSVGFWNPVTLLTSLAAGPASDLITSIAGTLAKDGVDQAASGVTDLISSQELSDAAKLQESLAAAGELPSQGSVWTLPPSARGFQIEADLGGDLPYGFPTIDKFDNGVATSIKSVDLAAPSYQNPSALLSRLRGYVNKVASFTGGVRGDARIVATQVRERVLEVAIPQGAATPVQQAALDAAEQYAQTVGVVVKVVEVP